MTPDAPAATTPTAVVTEPSASYHIADSRLWWHNFTEITCDPDMQTKTVRYRPPHFAPRLGLHRHGAAHGRTGRREPARAAG